MIRCSVVVALLLVPAIAGGEPTAIEKSTADVLFKEGKALMEKKNFDAGCPKLAESHRLQPGGGVILALAICYEGQGKLASAWNSYREALALALRDKRKDREDAARGKVADLEPRLSRLTIRAQGVTVSLDGVAMPSASLGTAIPIDGGAHVVEATAPGRVARRMEIAIGAEKDRKEVEVPALEAAPIETPKPAAAPAPVSPPAPARESGSVLPYVVGGLGLVALGVGGYFGVTAIGKRSDVKTACPDNVCTDPAMVDRNDEAKRAATISNVAIGVGAVAVGAAIVLFVVDKPEKKSARVTGGIGPRGASIGVEVAW